MTLWDKEGIPHKGWVCIDMVDVGELLNDLDPNERKDYYETCQMCSQEGVRFVHVMEHPEYNDQLRVGYKCAEKMEEDYINPKIREKKLRNKHKRRVSFLRQNWTAKANGNYCLKYKGYYITIMPSKYKTGEYGIIFKNSFTWTEKGNKIKSLKKAKLMAFELVDNYISCNK